MSWFKRKKIVIFGCGSGGVSAYKRLSHQYNVIGFIDNSNANHGNTCCGKTIFSPDDLSGLPYESIIIASDYYKEINTQLIHQYAIPEKSIHYFQTVDAKNSNRFVYVIHYYVYFLLNRMPYRGLFLLHTISLFLTKRYRKTRVLRIKWLDQSVRNVVNTFELLSEKTLYGPNYTHRSQTIKTCSQPAINAYLFSHAVTTTTSRSWIADKKIYIERLPHINKYHAEHASGQILYHGGEFALVNKGGAIKVQKGIAITGVSDTNYYHWLIEIIPQIFLIEQLSEPLKSFPILISEKIKEIPSIYEVFNNLLIENEIIFLKSNQKYIISKLVVFTSPNLMLTHLKETNFSPVESSYVNAKSLWLLRENVLGWLKTNEQLTCNTPKYIFLARRGIIRKYNQDEVAQLLHSFDFSIIFLEDLSFSEQVSYIQGADIIISPSGAGLANLVFAKEGTQVLYWAALSNGNASCFSNLARAMNIDLDCIGYNVSSNSTRETYYLPYSIPCNEITEWLSHKLPQKGA